MTLEEQRVYQKQQRQNNPEKVKAAQKRYHDSHREQIKKYYERTKEIKLQTFRLKTYGLTNKRYQELLLKQNNLCAICLENKPLEIDHDHATKIVRGLLCQECNLGLGKFKDSTTILKKAIYYLCEVLK